MRSSYLPHAIFSELEKTLVQAKRSSISGPRPWRASSLPICGLYRALSGPKTEEELDYKSNYYFATGHAAHTVWQDWMNNGHFSSFGDWKCQKCGKLQGVGFKPWQCECESVLFQYEELTIDDDVPGHIDKVKWYPNWGFHLWDLKTAGNVERNRSYYPYPKNVDQIEHYAYMLLKHFGIKVKSIGLLYQSRDAPIAWRGDALSNNDYWIKVLKRKDWRRLKSKARAIAAHKNHFLQWIDTGKSNPLISTRPCFSYDDYKSKMKHAWFGNEGCPFTKWCCEKKESRIKRKLALMRDQWEGVDPDPESYKSPNFPMNGHVLLR